MRAWVYYNGPDTWQATGKFENQGFPYGENINLSSFSREDSNTIFLVPGDKGFDELRAWIVLAGEKFTDDSEDERTGETMPPYMRLQITGRELYNFLRDLGANVRATDFYM